MTLFLKDSPVYATCGHFWCQPSVLYFSHTHLHGGFLWRRYDTTVASLANGDSEALEHLTPRVYRELRRVAGRLLQNERPGYSLQSTDLVHEVYLRLVNTK